MENMDCNGTSQDEGAVGNSTPCPLENFTCYNLSDVPNGALAVHTFFLALIGLLSLLANGLVLFLVAKYKRLRSNHSVLLTLLLVASDLALTVTYILPTFVTTIYKEWEFGKTGCVAFGFLASDFLLTRWMIISLFCMDRFFNVKFPFKYKRRRKVILIVLSVAAWLIPAVATGVPIQVFAGFELRSNIPTCLPECNSKNRYSGLCKVYYAITSSISFFMGSILPMIIYSWLYCKGKTARMSIRNSIGHITLQVTGGIIKKPYTDYKTINDRDRRATLTFMLVFITVLVTAAPAFTSQAIRASNIKFHCSIPIYVHFVILHILLLAFILNPLFIMRDADFRHCLRHLFCCSGTEVGNSFNTRPPDQIQDELSASNPNYLKTQSLTKDISLDHLELPLEHLELSTKDEDTLNNTGSSETVSYTSV